MWSNLFRTRVLLLNALLSGAGMVVPVAESHAGLSPVSLIPALSIRDKRQLPPDNDGGDNAPRAKSAVGVAVRHVELESAEPLEGAPSSTLKFDLFNEVGSSITDVVVSVSFIEVAATRSAVPRVIVGPFEIRLKKVLLADYSIHYELRLRNLSADCLCVPTVRVLDARTLLGSDSLSADPRVTPILEGR